MRMSAVRSKRSQPVRNLSFNPSADNNLDNFSPIRGTAARQMIDGRWVAVYTPTEANSAGGNRINCIVDHKLLIAGRTYTALVEGRALSSAQRVGVGFEWGGPERYMNFSRTPFSVDEWVVARNVFIMPADTGSFAAMIWAYVEGANPLGTPAFAISRVALIEGDYSGPIPDGDSPGWTWLGTPGNSVSVGYPYTLESIAGSPLAQLVGPGSISVPSIPALQGRTLYSVYDSLGTQDHYVPITIWGGGPIATTGGFRIQSGATGAASSGPRIDTGNGSVNLSWAPPSDNRSPGRHLMCVSINQGMTQARLLSDAYPESVRPVTPGDGMPFVSPILQNLDSANTDARATYLFATEHNIETRQRVMDWLRMHYAISSIPTDLDGGTYSTDSYTYTADGGTFGTTSFDTTFDGGPF